MVVLMARAAMIPWGRGMDSAILRRSLSPRREEPSQVRGEHLPPLLRPPPLLQPQSRRQALAVYRCSLTRILLLLGVALGRVDAVSEILRVNAVDSLTASYSSYALIGGTRRAEGEHKNRSACVETRSARVPVRGVRLTLQKPNDRRVGCVLAFSPPHAALPCCPCLFSLLQSRTYDPTRGK